MSIISWKDWREQAGHALEHNWHAIDCNIQLIIELNIVWLQQTYITFLLPLPNWSSSLQTCNLLTRRRDQWWCTWTMVRLRGCWEQATRSANAMTKAIKNPDMPIPPPPPSSSDSWQHIFPIWWMQHTAQGRKGEQWMRNRIWYVEVFLVARPS